MTSHSTRPPSGGADAVLIGGFGQLRPLVAAGIHPLVVPGSADATISHSRYFRDSGLVVPDLSRSESAFVQSLVRLSERLPSPPVLYYGDDAVLGVIARNQPVLRRAYRFEMPEAALVEACLDKTRFAALAEERGLPLPRQRASTPGLDSATIERSVGFPCVLKPALRDGWFEIDTSKADGRRHEKILTASDDAECTAALAAMRAYSDDFLVQEFIPGGEDQIYSFHAYVPRGPRKGTAYVGRKIRTYPSVGGESTLLRLVHSEEVLSAGWDVVDRLGLTGIMKIDFKRSENSGRLYVLEINLRFSLWTHLGASCGINLAEVAYREQCGLPYGPATDYRTDVRWVHGLLDVKAFFRDYRPAGQLSFGAWLRSYMRPKVYAVFAWDDPLPFLIKLTRKLKQAAAGMLERMRARGSLLGEPTA